MLKNVISVIDGVAGSCGKAKVIGEIATDRSIKVGAAITNCMPNAGHTFMDGKGNRIVFKNIPVSTVNKDTELFIGPGSAIDMDLFQEEYKNVSKYLGNRKIYVHEMVPLIEERHKAYERKSIKSGSTFRGCGAVSMEKIIRDENLNFFQTYKNAISVTNEEYLDRLYKHLENPYEYVLLEGAQGCDLSLNHSGNYPFVTSRNVSTTQLLADSGISAERLLQTIMVIRPFPIRISNVTKSGDIIYTGDYGNGEELTWSQVNIASMYGTYLGHQDMEELEILEQELLTELLSKCPEIYLKQLFGKRYQNVSVQEISVIEALELERLVYKSMGKRKYQSRVVDLSIFGRDDYQNMIFDQSEQTTVTKMERRIFDLDIKKLKNNCRINTPSSLYLNFLQHLDLTYQNQIGNYQECGFNRYIREYFNWLESSTGVEISTFGTGPKNGDKIWKKRLVKDIQKG